VTRPRSPLARSKEREIARAGKLLFGAFFGEGETMGDGLARAIAEEDGAPVAAARAPTPVTVTRAATATALAVPSYTTVRCGCCPREAVLPSNTPSSALVTMGWRGVRFVDESTGWQCADCVAASGR
jgi:hypothetical protein